jgi:hypothetical protein
MKRKLWWLLQSRYGRLSTREPTPNEVMLIYLNCKPHSDFTLSFNVLNWFRYLEHCPPITTQEERRIGAKVQYRIVRNVIEKHYNLNTFEIITKVERL